VAYRVRWHSTRVLASLLAALTFQSATQVLLAAHSRCDLDDLPPKMVAMCPSAAAMSALKPVLAERHH
jgi:hypothetical protein